MASVVGLPGQMLAEEKKEETSPLRHSPTEFAIRVSPPSAAPPKKPASSRVAPELPPELPAAAPPRPTPPHGSSPPAGRVMVSAEAAYVPKAAVLAAVGAAQQDYDRLREASAKVASASHTALDALRLQFHEHYSKHVADVRQRAAAKLTKLKADREAARADVAALQVELHAQVSALQDQLAALQADKAELEAAREAADAAAEAAATVHAEELAVAAGAREAALAAAEEHKAALLARMDGVEACVQTSPVASPRAVTEAAGVQTSPPPRVASLSAASDVVEQFMVQEAAAPSTGEADLRAEVARLNGLVDAREDVIHRVELQRAQLLAALSQSTDVAVAVPGDGVPPPQLVAELEAAKRELAAVQQELEVAKARPVPEEVAPPAATAAAPAATATAPAATAAPPTETATPPAVTADLEATKRDLLAAQQEIAALKAAAATNTTISPTLTPTPTPTPKPRPFVAMNSEALFDTSGGVGGDVMDEDSPLLAELRAAEAAADDKRGGLSTARAEQARLKHKIRAWMAAFEKREGRKPEKDDKRSIREDYVAYRSAEQAVEAATAEVEAATAEVERLAAAVEASRADKLATVEEVEEEEAEVALDEDAVDVLRNLLAAATETVNLGKTLWAEKKKRECLSLFQKQVTAVLEQLRGLPDSGTVVAAVVALDAAVADSKEHLRTAPAKSAVILRKALDGFVEVVTGVVESAPPGSPTKPATAGGGAEAVPPPAALAASDPEVVKALADATKRVAVANAEIKALKAAVKTLESAAAPSTRAGRTVVAAAGAGSKPSPAAARDAAKVKQLDKTNKELRTKIRQLEAAATKMPGGGHGPTGGISQKEVDRLKATAERKAADAEKKAKKAMDEAEKAHGRKVAALEKQLAGATKAAEETQERLAAAVKENKALTDVAGKASTMEKELETLRGQVGEVASLTSQLAEETARSEDLERLYKEEQILRKRYWNMMEDMKGKIRVFCRCRPMSRSELDRGSASAVDFPDEVTINVGSSRGDRQFVYDQCFGPASTQEEVFEDTKNLIQSSIDGYNVCIFAYGQTGSGKTFTMTGVPDLPGIIPRAVSTLFDLMDKNSKVCTFTISTYMVELYNDVLVDLYYLLEKRGTHDKPPRLDVGKDAKGMVVIKNVVMRQVKTGEELLALFDEGNSARHVGSTKMNAESSRSHLVFAVLITSHNRQTNKTITGKVSLVDLAGSERVGKTGASADRLREAQSINKSLSALGDVISALSSGEKFIPYRNNKLTQLMSDSLGGNAKTLMFVNVSPADYNAEETQTSLAYASRVKLITNNASKNSDNAEIARLKKIIANLKAGGDGTLEEEGEGEGEGVEETKADG